MPDIIKSGQIIKEEKNWKGRKYDGFIIAAPVEIAGIACIGTVVIHKDEKSQRFYLQEVILREKLQQNELYKTEALTNNNVALNGNTHTGAVASLLQKIYAVNASKIVDENGEPRILYHGTDADISEFSAKKIRNSADLRLGAGFYFTENTNESEKFGSVLMPVFLNIKNPFEYEPEQMSKLRSLGISVDSHTNLAQKVIDAGEIVVATDDALVASAFDKFVSLDLSAL